jgi:hypothetical protein
MSNQPAIRKLWAAGTIALLTAALLAACSSINTEEGRFACGEGFCKSAVQICMQISPDGSGGPVHECRVLPQGCSEANCGGCVDQAAKECDDVLQCRANADGDITVDCTTF